MPLSPTSWPSGGSASIGTEQSYAEFTATASITAATEGAADTVVTAAAFTADGTSAYLIEFFCPLGRPDIGAAGRSLSIWLYQDGASIGNLAQSVGAAAASDYKPLYGARRLTPSAGSRTYSIRASVSAGTGTLFAGLGGLGNVEPGFIRITKAT